MNQDLIAERMRTRRKKRRDGREEGSKGRSKKVGV